MFKKTRTSQGGFSLVELMVVVAIIGVLASIAVPSVNKYIAKARQSEAKTALSSIYTSEKAFYAEYTGYHSMFGAIGYSPEGKLRYNVGFSAAGTPAGALQGYNNAPNAAPANTISSLAYCTQNVAMPNGCMVLNGATNLAPPAVPATILTVTAFTAAAAAIVHTAGAEDRWTINQNKELLNTQNGIP